MKMERAHVAVKQKRIWNNSAGVAGTPNMETVSANAVAKDNQQ